ncbi:hypothetical protein [Methylocella sp.]|uniref:hypothetical protein n=1 Tax=Methylocella sp. TaxID=1978226 RepID=UPI0035B3F1CA
MAWIKKATASSPEREALRAAQGELVAAEKGREDARQARQRGEAREALLVAELAASVAKDEDATRALAASFGAEEQAAPSASPASATPALQVDLERTRAAVAILRGDEEAAEARLAQAGDALVEAVDAVEAAVMEERFAEARQKAAELRELCEPLSVYWADRERRFGPLRAFLEEHRLLLHRDHPVFVSSSAVERVWRKALETDYAAQPDPAAGRALQKAEEAEQVRREEERARRIAEDRREVEEARAALQKENAAEREAAESRNRTSFVELSVPWTRRI